jgi:hypothetical protein
MATKKRSLLLERKRKAKKKKQKAREKEVEQFVKDMKTLSRMPRRP